MTRRENELKELQVKWLRKELPGFVVQVFQQYRDSGTPDISVDGNGRGTWWEFKHGTPDFTSKGIQELTALRLAAANHCRYIIFHENSDGTAKRTLIVHPHSLHNLTPEAWTVGFDHRWVCEFIKQVHYK